MRINPPSLSQGSKLSRFIHLGARSGGGWHGECSYPDMIELHLRLRARAHQSQLLGEALRSLAHSVRLDPGCNEAWVWAEVGDPNVLSYVELWESESALCCALRSVHFTRLVALMETAIEPPALEFRFIAETRGLEFARDARGAGGDEPPGTTT